MSADLLLICNLMIALEENSISNVREVLCQDNLDFCCSVAFHPEGLNEAQTYLHSRLAFGKKVFPFKKKTTEKFRAGDFLFYKGRKTLFQILKRVLPDVGEPSYDAKEFLLQRSGECFGVYLPVSPVCWRISSFKDETHAQALGDFFYNEEGIHFFDVPNQELTYYRPK